MSRYLPKTAALLDEIDRLRARIQELEDYDRRRQSELREAAELGEAVIECSPIPMFVVTLDGRLRRWNTPFEILTGYTSEQLPNTTSSNLFDGVESFQKLVSEAGLIGRSEGKVEVLTRVSARVTIDTRLERIHCHGNYRAVGVLFDASEKERHSQLRRSGAVARAKVAMLSKRQKEVFDRVVKGAANKNIADQLGISEKTVEMHRSQMMRKLDVANLASLVRLAVLAELAEPA